MYHEDQPLEENEAEPELDFATECLIDGIDPDLLYIALLTYDLPEITLEDLERMSERAKDDDEENS